MYKCVHAFNSTYTQKHTTTATPHYTTPTHPLTTPHPQALQVRLDAFQQAHRRVIIVGDLNIAPLVVDRASGEPLGFLRRDRAWLHGLLRYKGGPFVDAYRELHPNRYIRGGGGWVGLGERALVVWCDIWQYMVLVYEHTTLHLHALQFVNTHVLPHNIPPHTCIYLTSPHTCVYINTFLSPHPHTLIARNNSPLTFLSTHTVLMHLHVGL